MKRWLLPLPLAAVAGAWAACREATQITLELTTNVNCGQVADHMARIFVGGDHAATLGEVAATGQCESGRIGSLVLVPSGDDDEAVRIEVVLGVERAASECTATDLGGCILARRRLRYLPHSSLRLLINLDERCIDVVCGPEETCVAGECKSAWIDDSSLCEADGCDESVLAGGGPIGPDAGSDAGPDSGTDGGPEPPLAAALLSAGASHACSVTEAGNVRCWGWNDSGQVGSGATESPVVEATTVLGLESGVLAVAAGGMHSCARLDSGALRCWGSASDGALGNDQLGGVSAQPSAVPVLNLTDATARWVAAGTSHTCAALNGAGVRCWGSNDMQQLVGSAGVDSPLPIQATTAEATAVSAGFGTSCALLANGSVSCWGYGIDGELGDGDLAPHHGLPSEVGDVEAATWLTSGPSHSCAVAVGASVVCWGNGTSYKLGTGSEAHAATPQLVNGLPPAIAVSAGGTHTCALTTAGEVWCWGANSVGAAGNTDGPATVAPTQVAGIDSAVAVAAGFDFSCARLESGAVYCWGSNQYGSLGNGNDSGGWTATPGPVVGLP